MPNRFDFVLTPKHASWLNLIEVFLAKRSKQRPEGIRVNSPEELADRMFPSMDGLYQDPVPFRWRESEGQSRMWTLFRNGYLSMAHEFPWRDFIR